MKRNMDQLRLAVASLGQGRAVDPVDDHIVPMTQDAAAVLSTITGYRGPLSSRMPSGRLILTLTVHSRWSGLGEYLEHPSRAARLELSLPPMGTRGQLRAITPVHGGVRFTVYLEDRLIFRPEAYHLRLVLSTPYGLPAVCYRSTPS